MDMVFKTAAPGSEDLTLISAQARRELSADEIYTFAVRLCDNEIDRDFEQFSDETLDQLAGLFLGAPGIFDHCWSAKGQTARLYRTEVVEEPGALTADGLPYRYLKGWAYMMRTEDNADLIAEIEGGIKREVSVGCAVEHVTCSVCGRDLYDCPHEKGQQYDGKTCHGILSGASDAYEWSFVAVPAQRQAGVVKNKRCGIPDYVPDDKLDDPPKEDPKALRWQRPSLSWKKSDTEVIDMDKINKQSLYQLKADRAEALKAAESSLDEGRMEDHKAAMDKVKGFNDQIDRVEKLLEERERFRAQEPQEGGVPHAEQEPEAKGCDAAVKSFAAAARAGFPKTKAAGDFMSEGVDPDGGYTVPADISTKIIQFRESKESLLDEVRVIPVTTKSGKRTIKKRGQHQGFATVAEAAKFGKAATPQFAVMEYNIKKRGGYLPVTNELLEDSDNNIAAVAVEWLGNEARVTANHEILAIIQSKTPQDLKNLDGILGAWVHLGSAFRATSKLITNDDGLLWLGTLKDGNGRYLLTPNPADPKQLRLCVGPYTLPVKTYDNDTIPTEGGRIPMVLGDLKEGVVYWDRRVFSVKVFDQATIGEFNAAEQDMTIWRGSLRDDCTVWDDGAFINGYIAADGAGGAAG